ncbi:PEP-CTERM sorting domain-containing protein [Anabaena sp. FACHB-709]|uniref:PEP-CTERM protein-sorting domain-containing protein n=2 Tax=Nostocaceae TaxID=1162 RepID=A0A1Z4KHJ7_ANAVA|nr:MULTISPECIES: PEP-CTERM sorting domain-containing protein [Nostocaceae]BAY68466.1 hypothetical protein NIES23_12520 [Trichormus variabilis NIES-23]HBW32645.1 PEP-CTERM sorting domain-containing protein [Nostoc sp. UBA8866]MBD2171724.1 PEP-CTERM sorting domain-containing protein [Anabaena cylindrica FACHB-318]MBD2264243.1 PEP-CTERM sorting domain-containing protein [Anabaena sp. FACHB-709]MBD2273586.1 PEP-CTERM sorting domain-containing protein [Nostoc sp. PCC 7120 = FACHB-418]
MTSSILKKVAGVTVGTTLMFTIGETLPAQAANITYNFSNTSNTLTGSFSFDLAAVADDQQATIAEGLKIFAEYNGQIFTEADDSLASVFTDFSGRIVNGQFLGLNFVVPQFSVVTDSFIDANTVESVTYSTVPEPGSIFGLSVIGLGLLAGRKTLSFKKANTKA